MARMAPIYVDDLRPPLGATRSMSSITTPRMIPGAVMPRSVPMSAAPVFPGQPRPPMPTAAPQIQPMPQRQPMAQAKPAAAPSMAAAAPAAGGGLLNANVGAGLLGAASKIGGGPTRLPVSLGSQIGPALNQFAADYQASQLAAEKKARENALIQKYGPEALVPGALPKMLEIEGEKEALRARMESAKNLFGPVASSAPQGATAQAAAVAQQGPSAVTTAQGAAASAAATTNMPQVDPRFGIVMTPGRQTALRTAYTADATGKAFGDALRAYQKEDQDLVKDARNRLKPQIAKMREIGTKYELVERAVKLAASGKAGGTADILAINAMIKMVDEGVVKADEVDLQTSAGSLKTRITVWRDNAKKGDLLDNTLRQRMFEVAKQIMAARSRDFQGTVASQKQLAINNNVPWEKVFVSEGMKRFLETPASIPIFDFNATGYLPNSNSGAEPAPEDVTNPQEQ
jgi:hypothetical protein